MIDAVSNATNAYLSRMPKARRKTHGQFFTGQNTARFMAGLFSPERFGGDLSILDPGAGTGILSAAVVECLQKHSSVKRIRLVCYETDPNVRGILESNLRFLADRSAIPVEWELRTENYIASQADTYNHSLYAAVNPERFDLVIGNPPYKKLPKDALEARAMPDVCHGAPNLYFLFAAMALFNLKADAEMVFIIPRSWTSGVYFRRFRERFLRDGALERIHLFKSRDKVFGQEEVLQETMIVKIRKSFRKPDRIVLSSSETSEDFSSLQTLELPYSVVVSGSDSYVFLPTSHEEAATLRKLAGFKETLPHIGLRMKTGLTVDFRNGEDLRNSAEAGAVPLFQSRHIRDGHVVFPVGKPHEYIMARQPALLQRNANYLFLKRFTSKEERRRLQCGVYLARQHPGYPLISTQNKVNFIGGSTDLPDKIVFGLYVLFNSTLYDSYYRILNGSTQVNSTEINAMPVPSIDAIADMGGELLRCRDMSEGTCDRILESYL
ncbi:MAG: Eco57I restriction-modification methylase domain-containing protein [Kiritimatiellae bacterium]|nr:Eco57I restriction-modification methylase domain-containing protein [Kiritimatiellia bacterium]